MATQPRQERTGCQLIMAHTLALYLRHLVQALVTRFRTCGDAPEVFALVSRIGRLAMCGT